MLLPKALSLLQGADKAEKEAELNVSLLDIRALPTFKTHRLFREKAVCYSISWFTPSILVRLRKCEASER